MQRFLPSLTFTIVFVHESLEGKENYKDDWRMGRKHQTFIFCVESVLWYFFFGIAIIVISKSASLGCFHVASGMLENNAKLNKASFYFHPWQLFRTTDVCHTHSARIVFQGTLLAAYCVGFYFHWSHLLSYLCIHLYAHSRNWHVRKLRNSTHTNMRFWVILQRFLHANFIAGHTGQLQPTEFNVEMMKNWKKPPVS